MRKRLSDVGEFGLIAALSKLVHKSPSVIKGIGDDCAVIKTPDGEHLLLTADMLAEGVHFTRKMGARAIGHKAMACSVSDIAAMGGVPVAAVVSLGAPPDLNISFVKDLYRAMNSVAKKFHFDIIGGDTIKTKTIVMNVAMIGKTRNKKFVLRSGAQKGDYIFVTGALGRSYKSGKHLSFTPRLFEARRLMENFRPSAMIDISDGLAGDLGHILKESKAGAVLYEKLIPKTKGADLKEALYDGEDFELLFTLPAREGRRMIIEKQKFPFHYIGSIVDQKEGFILLTSQGKRTPVNKKGFTHF